MPPKNSRVTNVQVPGEAQKPVLDTATGSTANTALDTASTGGTPPGGDTGATPPMEGATGQDSAGTAGDAGTGTAPAFDIDALRAQIRAEEMGKLQDELSHQLKAASTVIGNNAAAAAPVPRSKSDYRNMRAADVDPATLTAPVLTLDGYVCPAAPEKK